MSVDLKKDSWPLLLRIWFYVQLSLVFDAAFLMLRPLTFPEGPLGKFFPVFHTYMRVDTTYADMNDPAGWTMGTICIMEAIILAYAVFFIHPTEQKKATKYSVMQWSDFIALMVSIMQFAKSIIVWTLGYYGGFAHVKHNELSDLILLFILPNAIWLGAPIFVFKFFLNKIKSTLAIADKTRSD